MSLNLIRIPVLLSPLQLAGFMRRYLGQGKPVIARNRILDQTIKRLRRHAKRGSKKN